MRTFSGAIILRSSYYNEKNKKVKFSRDKGFRVDYGLGFS